MGLLDGIGDAVGDLFGGIGSAVGGLAGGLSGSGGGGLGMLSMMGLSTAGGMLNNLMNYGLAQDQQRWSEYMASTAHQREVRDLIAAGLNPVLSANAGSVVPNYQRANMESVVPAVLGGISTAMSMKKFDAELELIKQQGDQAESATVANNAQAYKSQADAFKSLQDAQKSQAETRNTEVDTAQKASMLPGLRNAMQIDESDLGKAVARVKRVMDVLTPVISATNR